MEMSIFKDYKKTDTVEGAVYKTFDYGKFIIYEWNRSIDTVGLKRLNKSVEEYGWKKDPIIVNEELGVIDGQHRLEYAKEHKLPIYYTIISGLTKEDCQRMNSKRKAWKPKDYIKYYAVQGNKDYQKLYYIVGKYDKLPLSTILYAMNINCMSLYGMNGAKSGAIKEGKFTAAAKLEEVEASLGYINNLLDYIKIIRGRQDQFERAILFSIKLKGVDKTRMAKVIKENCYQMTPPASLEIAFKELERVYNRNLKKGHVYLLTEWKKTINKKED